MRRALATLAPTTRTKRERRASQRDALVLVVEWQPKRTFADAHPASAHAKAAVEAKNRHFFFVCFLLFFKNKAFLWKSGGELLIAAKF